VTAAKGTAERVLEVARGELGEVEHPLGSNKTKYGEAYGMNGVAWCAEFVWWVFQQAGVPLPIKTAYTPTLASAFQSEKRWLSNVSKDVEAGDVVLFYWPSMGRIAHVGIVEVVLASGDVQTIEGNSDVAGGRSGGKVVRHVRSRATVHAHGGFGVPRYHEEDDVTDADLEKIDKKIEAQIAPLRSSLNKVTEHLGRDYGPIGKALYTQRRDDAGKAVPDTFDETTELTLAEAKAIRAEQAAQRTLLETLIEQTKPKKP
jgi:hypothetical protein